MTPTQTQELDDILGMLCNVAVRLDNLALPGLESTLCRVNLACHDVRDILLQYGPDVAGLGEYAKPNKP